MLSLPPFPCVPYFSLSVFLHYNDRCVDKRVAWLRFWSRLIGLLLGRRETREAKDNYCNCLSIKCRAYVSLWSDGWIFLAKCSKLTEFVISYSFVDKVQKNGVVGFPGIFINPIFTHGLVKLNSYETMCFMFKWLKRKWRFIRLLYYSSKSNCCISFSEATRICLEGEELSQKPFSMND